MPLHLMAHHALWDAWVHERDIALPLGLTPAEEADEMLASLRYAAGLGPALLAAQGSTRTGRLVVAGTDPDAHLVVDLGETVVVSLADGAPGDGARLEGRTVDLVEALSVRGPLPDGLAEEDRWMLGGLATVFDQAPA
jgi:hypothetical protein